MYILLEQINANNDKHIENFDCMGWTSDVNRAVEWLEANVDYRKVKFCPDIER